MKKDKPHYISVIIPVMNEEENIRILADEIAESLRDIPWEWECVWVDDFSTDGTVPELEKIRTADKRHRILLHTMNYGQSAALATGFSLAQGDIFVTIDGDGQNDPAFIPVLVQKLIAENADMVNGWRKKRRDSIVRKISSKIANSFRNLLTGENIRDVGCALRAFRRECAECVPVFKGMHRFFPTLVRIAGHTKILEEPVQHRPRERGRTKYGINNRLWVGIADTFAVCWMRSRLVFPEVRGNDLKKEVVKPCGDLRSPQNDREYPLRATAKD